MVRVISSSALGFGDYGGRFSDVEVDGVSYEQEESTKTKEVVKPEPPPKAVKLTGGRKLK